MSDKRHTHSAQDPAQQAVELPEPSPEAKQHSLALQKIIADEIEQTGGIPFRRFMELALYQSDYGYYRTSITKFGAKGDFVTAPVVSPLFAESFVQFCQAAGLAWKLLEVGAGNGLFAAQFLTTCEQQGIAVEQYAILELSADSRERQRQNISAQCPAMLDKVTWLDSLPDKFDGYVIANELLDAMPVSVVKKQDQQFYEQYVVNSDDGFVFEYRPITEPRLLQRADSVIGDECTDYTTEINLIAEDWIRTLADCLEQAIVLLVDYGNVRSAYYHPQRSMGTLMCHFQQRAHTDPLKLAGLQDITAHVDFTAMADAALDAGLEVRGLATQAHFLMNTGILEILAAKQSDSLEQQLMLANEVKKLTLPNEMGETFKVLALSKGVETDIIGFQQFDIRHLL